MPTSLPKFERPPVIETVLNIQFQPIPDFTAAHIGYFWKEATSEHLPDWRGAKLYEQARIDDSFEDFTTGPIFRMPHVSVEATTPRVRIQIAHPDQERLIQIQDSRLIYNWRKKQSEYPTYKKIKPEFDKILECLSRFLQDGFSRLQPNQWEVVYINHIPKGTLWNEVADWRNVFPNLFVPPCESPADRRLETLGGSWRWVLGGDKGRLHLSLQHGKSVEPEEREVILLQLTARGPIDGARPMEAGFALGHETIVTTFYKMTSAVAHEEWRENT